MGRGSNSGGKVTENRCNRGNKSKYENCPWFPAEQNYFWNNSICLFFHPFNNFHYSPLSAYKKKIQLPYFSQVSQIIPLNFSHSRRKLLFVYHIFCFI